MDLYWYHMCQKSRSPNLSTPYLVDSCVLLHRLPSTASRQYHSSMGEKPEASQRPSSGRGIQQNILRVQHDADVYDRYEVTEVVGSGSMGHVAKVRIKADKLGGSAFATESSGGIMSWFSCCIKGQAASVPRFEAPSGEHTFALKSIHMDRISTVFLEELKNEIKILRSMDHPNIVKAHEVFMTKSQIYLILECCDGDLYTRAPYTERDSARMISQVCSAVRYMHEHNIVHRDLKVRFLGAEPTSVNCARGRSNMCSCCLV